MSASGTRLSKPIFDSGPKQNLLLVLILTAATLAVYQTAARNQFVNFDDDYYILANPHVITGFTWANVRWAFTAFYMGNWHPLTWLSHIADVEWFGLRPAGHHLASVFLHALNAVLLFWVFTSMTGHKGRSFMVAILFAVHPVNVESVAWVAERKNLLSTTFWLLGIGAYSWYANRRTWGRYLCVSAAFLAGLMAKAMLVTFPFVLFLLDYWPLRRFATASGQGEPKQESESFGRLLLEKVPLLLLTGAACVLTFRAESQGEAVVRTQLVALPLRMENALYSYAAYIRETLWPWKLAVLYPFPRGYSAMQLVAALVVLVGITGLVWRNRRSGYSVVGWLWFLGTLIPVIGLVQVGVQSRADRYMYVPIIGLLMMAVWGIAALSENMHFSKTLLVTTGTLAVAALSFATYKQIQIWHDSVSLWSQDVTLYPRSNFLGRENLANALALDGRCPEAVTHYEVVLQSFPENPMVRNDLASCLRVEGKLQEAMEQSELALKFSGETRFAATIRTNVGLTEVAAGQREQAENDFRKAIRLDPQRVSAYLGLGTLLESEGRNGEAAELYQQSLSLFPTLVAYKNLSQILKREGKLDEAEQVYREGEEFRRRVD